MIFMIMLHVYRYRKRIFDKFHFFQIIKNFSEMNMCYRPFSTEQPETLNISTTSVNVWVAVVVRSSMLSFTGKLIFSNL